MGQKFVTICVACTKGVTEDQMKYMNGHVFHKECYEKHGDDFLVVNQFIITENNHQRRR